MCRSMSDKDTGNDCGLFHNFITTDSVGRNRRRIRGLCGRRIVTGPYPALLAFGIPPVLANASNTVGVVGTGIGGVMGARKELKGQAVRSITYVVIGAFGGVAGAFLLLKLDPSVFEFAAPVLILLSSLIIAINPRGRMQAKQAAADATAQLKHIEATEATEAAKRATTPTAPHRPPEQLVQPMSQDSWWVWLGVAAVAIYSGYFGAGAVPWLSPCLMPPKSAHSTRSMH